MPRSLFIALAVLAVFAGCVSDPRFDRGTLYLTDSGQVASLPDRGRPVFDEVSYWDGDNMGGAPSITIHLGEQRAYFYKGGHLFGHVTGKAHIIRDAPAPEILYALRHVDVIVVYPARTREIFYFHAPFGA